MHAHATRQLTPRAVIAGMLLGGFMSLSNLYVVLKTGWSIGVTITAGILAFAIFALLTRLRVVREAFGMLENNAMQSVASAAGYMTGGGTVAAIPALMMITGEPMPGWQMFFWITSIALLGVVMAIPMKTQMIDVEQLRFPSGVAAAETLRALHAQDAEAAKKANRLAYSGVAGAMVAFFRDVHARWMPWNLPEKIAISGWALKGRPLLDYTIGLEGSLIMVGAGAIMGARAAWSMLLGAAVNFGVLAPWLYSDGVFDAPVSLPFDPEGQCADPWAWSEHTEPGLPGAQECLEAASYDWYCELAMLGTSTDTVLGYKNIVAWSVWFGSAMILTSGLLAFAFQWRTVLRAIQSVGSAFSTAATAGGTREVPMSWFFFGMALFAPLVVFLQWLFFGIHPLLGVVAVVLSFFIAIVASRATGETDTTPTGALGKITQITFGALDPGNTTTNLMTANVTGGVGLHCADLLTDLKSGYLLKADPRQQFWGQFFGVLAGSLFVVPAYRLLIPTAADIGTDKWPAPGAQTWKGVAEMLAKGFFTLHPTAQVALLVGAVLGIVLVLLEKFVPRVKPYLPSATAFGMAFTTPAYNTVSMCVGAAIAVYLEKRRPKLAEDAIVPVSSGLIAGESLMGVAVAALVVLGLLEG